MTDDFTEVLARGANHSWKLELTDEQLGRCRRYADHLVEWNRTRMNLTRITTPSEIAVKHFLDSFSLLTVIAVPEESRLVDIGTGAGFPGLALAIARPDLKVTLIEATQKKLDFCRFVAADLNLGSIAFRHARAEEAAREPTLSAGFDFVTARAVAPLDKLFGWMTPFAAPGGVLAAWKGPGIDSELAGVRRNAAFGHWRVERPVDVRLPETSDPPERCILIARRSRAR